MDDPLELHNPFNGDATSASDEPDAFSSLWDELNAGDPTQPCPQSTDSLTEPTRSSNKKGKMMRFKMGKRKLVRTASFFRKSGMAPLNHLWRRCATP